MVLEVVNNGIQEPLEVRVELTVVALVFGDVDVDGANTNCRM